MSQTTTEIARATLIHLAELGLPPTPENYVRYYYQTAGEPPPDPCNEIAKAMAADEELMGMVKLLIETITHRTSGLADNLGQSNESLKRSVSDLEEARDKNTILDLLARVVQSAGQIQTSVESTRDELLQARHSLDEIRSELEESRKLLNEDVLTGALNRRGMDLVLIREINRGKASGGKLTVAMVDLDHFKLVNDTYGHTAGDQALQHFAVVARSVLRESDSLVRYGGEEFLLILPDSAISGAEFVLNRMRQMVRNSPLNFENQRIELACSAGLAQLKSDENAHSLVMRADQALYAAKQAGRDCIRLAD